MAAGLRDGGFAGDITLIGSEPHLPYERPHLSKGYLLGTVDRDRLGLRPATQYRRLGVELELGRRVRSLGLDERRVLLDDGKTIGWDLVCIATGSGARRLQGFARALYLRELADADAIRRVLDSGAALDIVGAGFIGCEVAAVAAQKDCRVRVFEALEQPLVRVLGPELSAYVAEIHRRRGVDLRLSAQPAPELEAPLVAVGSAPRTQLAEEAQLGVDRGIVVDAMGRTLAAGVFAAGDATRFYSPFYGTHIRVEHFQTSQRQGFAVGRAMAGASEPYREVPWFWSDQYDMNLQYAGAGMPWDEIVVRGKLGEPPFTVFYLSGGELVAAAGVNDHHTVARARHAMQTRARLTRRQLEDPRFDLRKAPA